MHENNKKHKDFLSYLDNLNNLENQYNENIQNNNVPKNNTDENLLYLQSLTTNPAYPYNFFYDVKNNINK